MNDAKIWFGVAALFISLAVFFLHENVGNDYACGILCFGIYSFGMGISYSVKNS